MQGILYMKDADTRQITVDRLKYYLIIGYALIVIGAIIVVSVLERRATTASLKSNVSTLVSSLSEQMSMNLSGYLNRMETIATLAFAEEDTYKYDATDASNDEYEAVQREKEISDNLFGLCIMDNFVDYGIVYRNNHTIGKLSNGTITQFGDTIFTDLESIIDRQRTDDGWAAGFGDNYKRIYYVKRIHENALIVVSFYTDELRNIFVNADSVENMSIRLLNDDYNVLYSSVDINEVGRPLDKDIKSRIKDNSDATLLDDKYLISINSCGYKWYVVCSIPTKIIMNEQSLAQKHILLAAILATLLAVIISVIMSLRLTRPVESYVSDLDIKAKKDQLTGVYNKLSFESAVKSAMGADEEERALILIDIDDFKSVNDTLGHIYGDKVLKQTGETLRNIFSEEDFIGRIGGDEFSVLINSRPSDDTDYLEYIAGKCNSICEAFRDFYTGDESGYKISVSVGCALYPKDGKRFKELYKSADQALYISKRGGKDTYTITAGCPKTSLTQSSPSTSDIVSPPSVDKTLSESGKQILCKESLDSSSGEEGDNRE